MSLSRATRSAENDFFLILVKYFLQFFEVSASMFGFNQIRARFGLFRQNVSGKTVLNNQDTVPDSFGSALVSIRIRIL